MFNMFRNKIDQERKIIAMNEDVMDSLLETAIANKIKQTEKELQKTKEFVRKYIAGWTTPVGIDATIKGARTKAGLLGVYKIIHKNSGVMYIGQGNVSNRKNRHLSVFKNKGKEMVSPNGHSSSSQAGTKMYAFDQDIDNWLFSFIMIDNKGICAEYEKVITDFEMPQFNSPHMVGKS